MNDAARSLAGNLAGAWDVMLGRTDGLTELDLSVDGFWRSFAAILLIAPFAAVALLSQRRLLLAAGEEAGALAGGDLGAAAAALLADWFLFPIFFAVLARPLGLGERYLPFIVVRNWSAVLVSGGVAVLHGLHLIGVLPAALTTLLLYIAAAVALRFAYVIARVTLNVSSAVALPLVAFDFLLSMTIWATVERLR